MHRGRQSGLYIAAAAALLGGYSLGVASTAARCDEDEDAPRALTQISMVRATAGPNTHVQQLEKIDAIIHEYLLSHTVKTISKKGI